MAKKKRAKQSRAKKTKAARKIKAPSKKQSTSKQQSTKKSVIEFCEKCGSIMVPVKKGSTHYMKCRGCGKEIKKEMKSLKIVEEKIKSSGIPVIEHDTTLLPLTDKECPSCEHDRAYWWLQQTRSADEPPTQFFRCEKCKHTWREYK